MNRAVESVGEAGAEIHHPLCQLCVGLLEVQDNGLSALEALGKGLGPLVEAGWFRYTHLVARIQEVAEGGFRVREPLFLLCMLKPRRRQLLERQRVTYLFCTSHAPPWALAGTVPASCSRGIDLSSNKYALPPHLVEALYACARVNRAKTCFRHLQMQSLVYWFPGN